MGTGLFNTGLIRNCLYEVKRFENRPAQGGFFVLVNALFAGTGGWRGRTLSDTGETDDSTKHSFWMLYEDWSKIFSTCFIVRLLDRFQKLDAPGQHAWSPALNNCGGTPIPVKQPMIGTLTSWGRNPQFLLDLTECRVPVENV